MHAVSINQSPGAESGLRIGFIAYEPPGRNVAIFCRYDDQMIRRASITTPPCADRNGSRNLKSWRFVVGRLRQSSGLRISRPRRRTAQRDTMVAIPRSLATEASGSALAETFACASLDRDGLV
jgi:hypothetical protein